MSALFRHGRRRDPAVDSTLFRLKLLSIRDAGIAHIVSILPARGGHHRPRRHAAKLRVAASVFGAA